MTLNTYLTRLRVCQAQNLLVSTDQDASQIALKTGFGSITRFYESFKTVSGTTPLQYRMQAGLPDYGSESSSNSRADDVGETRL